MCTLENEDVLIARIESLLKWGSEVGCRREGLMGPTVDEEGEIGRRQGRNKTKQTRLASSNVMQDAVMLQLMYKVTGEGKTCLAKLTSPLHPS